MRTDSVGYPKEEKIIIKKCVHNEILKCPCKNVIIINRGVKRSTFVGNIAWLKGWAGGFKYY